MQINLVSYQLINQVGCEPISTVASHPFGRATLSSVQGSSSKVSHTNAGLKPGRVADFKRVMLEHLAPSRPCLPELQSAASAAELPKYKPAKHLLLL